ncbi:MAG: superoxide dismutase family protein [Symploca sp. SIO2B6]|nr:superoxide dismutase family protein [Symploca sp. SIO2B6]
MTTIKITAITIFSSILILLSSCQPQTAQKADAQAIINTTSEPSTVMGKVSFSETEEGLLIEANLEQVPPGKHGFHIHETGSCEDGGKAAGGHFNPDGVQHGLLIKDGFENAHAGDLGNITVSPEGTGTMNVTIPGLTLSEGKYALGNLSVIVHEKPDDFGQPTGNAGGRIGCGIIKVT